jgi:hypothetical protein
VDTGAAFSVFPHSSASPPVGPALAGAAGRLIPCWGERQFRLSFNGKVFLWPFLLAAVQFPILGVDFFAPSDSWWTQLGTGWWTGSRGRLSSAALQRLGTACTWPRVSRGPRLLTLLPTGLFSPASSWAHRPLLFSPASPQLHRPLLFPPASSRVHRPLPLTPASSWPHRPLQPPVARQPGPQASHV